MSTQPEVNPDFRPVSGVDGLKGMNTKQRLYVMPCGDGVSCLGFDNAHAGAVQAATITGRPELNPPKRRGTVRAFRAYKAAQSALIAFYREHPDRTHFDPGTPYEVTRALESARSSGQRVRIWCGDTKTGRAWAEEYDVTGTIGRSMGPLKSPLLLPLASSHGGAAILTACVVAIRTQGGAFLYRHPKFNVGVWAVEMDKAGELTRVTHNGETYANMTTKAKAMRLAEFMRGDRFTK